MAEPRDPSLIIRLWWLVWPIWNRIVCATRGHVVTGDESPLLASTPFTDGNAICARCGLPLPLFDESSAR